MDKKRKRIKKAVELFEKGVGLEDKADTYPNKLSGGQKTARGNCACIGNESGSDII